jgi:hypothetical protein
LDRQKRDSEGSTKSYASADDERENVLFRGGSVDNDAYDDEMTELKRLAREGIESDDGGGGGGGGGAGSWMKGLHLNLKLDLSNISVFVCDSAGGKSCLSFVFYFYHLFHYYYSQTCLSDHLYIAITCTSDHLFSSTPLRFPYIIYLYIETTCP